MFDLKQQPELPFTGEYLKDVGMRQASENAEEKFAGWNERALELLRLYCEINKREFMAEYFRSWAEVTMDLPAPPNARAYGSVIAKAKKLKIIEHCGYSQVSNHKAHKANASVWRASKVKIS